MNYDIRWVASTSAFSLTSPWWVVTHDRQGRMVIVGAVRAADPAAALALVQAAHADPAQAPTELLACELRPDDWSPFGPKTPRKEWMQW